MNFFNEYGLLVAVATPVAVVVGLQVYLFFAGERGTLLLPSLRPYDSIAIEPPVAVAAEAAPPRTVCETTTEAEDSLERLAA